MIYMTRRAFLSSKSNTAAGEIVIKHACQKSWQIASKNEDCSKSVSSIDSGAIFQASLGQELSRNAFVVSILSFWKNLYVGIGPGHDPKSSKFSKKYSLRARCSIWAALPGAQNPDGSSPPRMRLHMACRDGRQYFSREQRLGKSSCKS